MRRDEPCGSSKRGRGRRRSRVEARDEGAGGDDVEVGGAGGDEDEAGQSKMGVRARLCAPEPRTKARPAAGCGAPVAILHLNRVSST